MDQRFRSNSNPEISIDELEGAKENLFRVNSCQPPRISDNRNLRNMSIDTIDGNTCPNVLIQSDNTPLISSSENIQSPDNKKKIYDTFYWTVIYLSLIHI